MMTMYFSTSKRIGLVFNCFVIFGLSFMKVQVYKSTLIRKELSNRFQNDLNVNLKRPIGHCFPSQLLGGRPSFEPYYEGEIDLEDEDDYDDDSFSSGPGVIDPKSRNE